MLLLRLLVATATTSTVAQTTTGQFLPNCVSDNDYGWPRFHRVDELRNSSWSAYFTSVYGELPTQYPVCVYDFWRLDAQAYVEAGLNGTRPFVDPGNVSEGDLFAYGELEFGIYHNKWEPIPNNTWVEVTHSVLPTETMGAWVWNQRGSGVWYNTGRTVVFPTPSNPSQIHAEAIKWLREGCSHKISVFWPQLESDIFGACAREKGIDSIQFEPQQGEVPTGTFGITGRTEMVLVGVDGNETCGMANASATPLRSGWMASRVCDCQNEPIPDTCGLEPQPPPGVPGVFVHPPLCEVWKENHSNSCDPTTCGKWHCQVE